MMSALNVEPFYQYAPVNVASWELGNSSTSCEEPNSLVETKSALARLCNPSLQEAQRSSHSPPSVNINAQFRSAVRSAPTDSRTSSNTRDICSELTIYVMEDQSEFTTKAIEGLTKRLRRDPVQVDHMLSALSTGMKETPCVTFAKTRDGRIQIAKQKCFPSETFFRLFRNPSVRTGDIIALPECLHGNTENGSLVCVNPYHYRQRQPAEACPASKRRRAAPQQNHRDTLYAVAPIAAAHSYAQAQWAPMARLEQQHCSTGSNYNPNNGMYANRQAAVGVVSPYVYSNQFAYLQDPSARMMRAPVTPTIYQHQSVFYPDSAFQAGSTRTENRNLGYMASQFTHPAATSRVRLASESNDVKDDDDVIAV
ncbi:hypothetical protein QR680_000684 [Steinernema hermaphroditum]|uniref:MH1 domain-containing protein n=1 Tax=Steinernema hermaphroditum TaxID=289476 RepID=A0AA39GWB9_9BILA|nr:hypothetical protein QR680_000684 [Steinernema hermaphroditum]